MMNPITLVGATIILGALLVAGVSMMRAYRKLRGTRLVTCPETRQSVTVELDTAHPALLRAVTGTGRLAVDDCSRWPAKRDCGQECLSQIQQAPDECRIRTMLTKWYEGRSCVLCGAPFGTIHWLDHKPGLWSLDGKVMEWAQVANETLPQVLASHAPVCWNCLIAEGFRAANPSLVIDRPDPDATRPPLPAP